MIIGLTGKNGSGKGEAANVLKEKGFKYSSLSDIIREEMLREQVEITRENLIQFANNLRAEKGAGYLGEATAKKIEHDAHPFFVIDSIRNPFEVEALRKLPHFYLIAIIADTKIRFERIVARNREKDPITYEAFLTVEAAEAGSNNPAAQQLDRVIQMADGLIENNGTLDELKEHLSQVLQTFTQIDGDN